MPEVEFVEHHQHPTGGTVTDCRLNTPMADLLVTTNSVSDLARSYACTITAEEYRRRQETDHA
ncbi:MAG: hypothetical protein KA755_01600 [Candidatus Microthrix sp.]|nr:hypothetical protein [Candidatus Microthrix sp.]